VRYGHGAHPYIRIRDKGNNEPVDEIDDYWRGRYLSTREAVWRILGFNITKKEPSVSAISVHLENDNTFHQYQHSAGSNTLSSLHHYFLRPLGAFTNHNGILCLFSNLTYVEYYSLFRLAKFNPAKSMSENYYVEQANRDGTHPMHVIFRSAKFRHYARMRNIPSARGELFYVRALLQCRPASSFLHLRTVDDVEHSIYQEAATVTDTSAP